MKNYEFVQSLAKGCKNCKEIETLYKTLISEGFDKETAKSYIKTAKAELKNAKSENKVQNEFIKGWFGDFEKVGKSLLFGICKEENTRISDITTKFNTVESFIREYVTKADSLGNPIHKIKGNWKYRKITANNVRSLLRECVVNYNSNKNGYTPNYVRIETAEVVTD